MRFGILVLVAVALFNTVSCPAADPSVTIAESKQVLAELVTIPGNEIPASLLASAEGLAVIPRVIKIGLAIGGRRGHGVVLVRDANGNWSLPRFVTLTGGSFGWQAGVSGTDVVLVFTTRRSVDGLLNGKFTIGVDAAAAAGPVGRHAAAATDTSLRAEILSYSRSRGLFLGASIDGSAIEVNTAASTAFYGSPDPSTAQTVPVLAADLQSYVTNLTASARAPAVMPIVQGPSTVAPASAIGAPAVGATPAVAVSTTDIESLRQRLVARSQNLSTILSPEWRRYLALPLETDTVAAGTHLAAIQELVSRFEAVATNPEYVELAGRTDFQSTRQLLHEYVAAYRSENTTLVLPSPPAGSASGTHPASAR